MNAERQALLQNLLEAKCALIVYDAAYPENQPLEDDAIFSVEQINIVPFDLWRYLNLNLPEAHRLRAHPLTLPAEYLSLVGGEKQVVFEVHGQPTASFLRDFQSCVEDFERLQDLSDVIPC